MTKNENQRLCGGTFFTLLIQARKPRKGVREHYKGESDGLSDPEMLAALIKVVIPDYNEPTATTKPTFKGNTSEYKSCKISQSAYLPFGDPSVVSAFDNRVKTDHLRALAAMSDFVDGFIDVGTSVNRDENLVKALVELIDVDDTIDDNQTLYIYENGATSTKAALRCVSEICLQSFLLGIWHFILVNRKDNTIGKATYDLWCPPNGGAERKYTGSLGFDHNRPIKITRHIGIVEDDIESDAPETGQYKEYGEQDKAKDEGDSAKESTQVVNNPVVFNQYGSNNIQIGNINTLTINNN